MRLMLATHNEHKRREFARLLRGCEVDALPASFELPPEEGETFEENALGKARAAAALSGRPAIADDSGIESEALGGAPGVRSARYAGEVASDEENLAKLVAEAPCGSRLTYRCALAYVDSTNGVEKVFHGSCAGTLTSELRGQRGFGYDPAFVPDELPLAVVGELTMAQLTDAQKDEISHRGEAARALLAWLTGRSLTRC